jgi:hypothetical protein
MDMTPPQFYLAQTTFSDPGAHASLYDTLPYDLDGLCRTVRGIYRHYMDEPNPTPDRLPEVDLRYVSDILDRAVALDPRALDQEREFDKRVVGCCRDAALLLVSILRHKGIPARLRVGFATYIRIPGAEDLNIDHVVAEVWDADRQRWFLVDPEQGPELIATNKLDFDPHDIPRDRFLVGGAAWELCRAGKADPDTFCGGPDDFFRGMWAVRARMIGDLLAFNRIELLLWDSWGWMQYEFEPDSEALALLDGIAAATQSGSDEAVRALYDANPQFHAPEALTCYSPTGDWTSVRPRYTF